MIQRICMIVFLAITSLLLGANDLMAQNFAEVDKSPVDIATFPKRGNEKTIKVVYSRPQAKGRKVFGDLVKYGTVWRTGANEATEITFYQSVKIGGKMVKAGTYTLFTIPTEGKWTIILNSELNQWGAYQYKESSDVLRVEANSKASAEKIETFSITIEEGKNGAIVYLGWENTVVEIPIEY